jgi:uncharacterized protein YndB with AHSA1/START domain
MTLDVTRLIGAVNRELSTRDDGARVMTATRTYATSLDDLWDALTNPERIPRWFMPITGDLEPGGHYQLEGNARGEILACEPPRLLGVTWEMQGQVSWVNVELSEEAPEATVLRLEHIAHVPDDFWDQFGPGAVGVGWDQALLGLDQHFAPGGPSVRPEDAAEWVASAEGKAFVRQSSDAWEEASIAGGTDPAAARAAAERTTAFYTGAAEG